MNLRERLRSSMKSRRVQLK